MVQLYKDHVVAVSIAVLKDMKFSVLDSLLQSNPPTTCLNETASCEQTWQLSSDRSSCQSLLIMI